MSGEQSREDAGEGRDVGLREELRQLANEASDAAERCRRAAWTTDRQYHNGKADAFAWAKRRLRGLLRETGGDDDEGRDVGRAVMVRADDLYAVLDAASQCSAYFAGKYDYTDEVASRLYNALETRGDDEQFAAREGVHEDNARVFVDLMNERDRFEAEAASMRAVVEAAEAVDETPQVDESGSRRPLGRALAQLSDALDAYRALTPSEEAEDGKRVLGPDAAQAAERARCARLARGMRPTRDEVVMLGPGLGLASMLGRLVNAIERGTEPSDG